ncbi:MAG: VWA domain-containing protein, partial [Thermoplasmata archaeon]
MVNGHKMARRGVIFPRRRAFSIAASAILLSSTLLIGISMPAPNAAADIMNHKVGNLWIEQLTDFGRILKGFTWQGTQPQDMRDPMYTLGYSGLVLDQDNYNHVAGSENIADSYKFWPYTSQDDLVVTKGCTMIIDDGTTQKSIGSFKNTGVGTGDPNDILINQTAWTVVNKDWAIIQWSLLNLKGSVLTNVSLGLELPLSFVGTNGGVGGDAGDDIDGFDASNDVYWVSDDSGTTIGFGSVIPVDPITHYYSVDYQDTYSWDDYKMLYQDDTWLYNRLHASNSVVGATPGNRSSTVGWDGITIDPGSSRTITLVVAVNDTYNNMINAIKDAQFYYRYVLTGFRITEFSDADSSTQQVEVYNCGREATDMSAENYFLSVDSGATPLSGDWDMVPLPTYEHGIFTLDPGENIGPEGATIGLYRDLGPGGIQLVDSVSYGPKGSAPDPLPGESTACYWDEPMCMYGNDWTRNPTPTFGTKNHVPAINPTTMVVINEVMFYPGATNGGYIVLINKDPYDSINVSDYYIVGDTEFQLSGFGDIVLEPFNKLIIEYSDYGPLFDSMDSGSDNVYLYNSTGSLLDMVGWSTPHLQGMSVKRTPDGDGLNNGYDDATSEAAGWVFNTPVELIVTEIADSESPTARIELYNVWYPHVNLTVGFTLESASSGVLAGTWFPSVVDSDEYTVFTVSTPNGLDAEGDTISLYQHGTIVEEISYGLKGVVPDPLPDESVERVMYLGNYTDAWSRNFTTGPNFGSQNDVPPTYPDSSVVLNEVIFNPVASADGFVELYLKYVSQNISGFRIVGNTEYIIPEGSLLTPDDPFFYLTYLNRPTFFDSLDPSGDNLYLYDNNGRFLDMAGWSSSHIQGKTMCRVPNGYGTRDGYDDASSTAAGWVFGCSPTIQLVKVSTKGPVRYGTFGEDLYFNLTITNKQEVDDTVVISSSTQNGYGVVILDETGTSMIDRIFVSAGSTVKIIVWVILPSTIPFSERDNITISIQSENTSRYCDSIVLEAVVLPFIYPQKSISPQEIYLSGTGHDELITITLNLTGMGSIIEFMKYQDVIFCVDTSGSMTNQAIFLIKDGLMGYVDRMDPEDAGAVVVFNSGAWLMNPLTNDHASLKDDIINIPGPGGSTYMGEALDEAIDELLANGNTSHIRVIILLTDGGWNGLINPIDQAYRAASNNITIFTIGLQPIFPYVLDEATLRSIADITGGQYFYAENADQIPEIYQVISDYIGDIAGRDTDTTDAKPMIRDVLPPWIELVGGSFSLDPETNYINETGYRILEWNLSQLQIGESWEVTFQVKSTVLGEVLTNDLNTSRVFYVDYFDRDIFKLFPECLANVLPPSPLPPKLHIDILPGKDDIYLYWDEPITPGIHHYLIYRATSPVGFDFSVPWVDTSNILANGTDPLDKLVIPLRRSWNHTGAADSNDAINYSQQWYYCMRSVNT